MICPLWNFEDVNLSGKWNCWLIREPWHLLSSTFVSFPDEKFIPDQYFLGTKWIDHSNNLLPRVVESDSLGRSLFSISKSFPDPLSKIWNFSTILNFWIWIRKESYALKNYCQSLSWSSYKAQRNQNAPFSSMYWSGGLTNPVAGEEPEKLPFIQNAKELFQAREHLGTH